MSKKLSEMSKDELQALLENDAERRTYADHIFGLFDKEGAGSIPRESIVGYIHEKYPHMSEHPLLADFAGKEGAVTPDEFFGTLSVFIKFLHDNTA